MHYSEHITQKHAQRHIHELQLRQLAMMKNTYREQERAQPSSDRYSERYADRHTSASDRSSRRYAAAQDPYSGSAEYSAAAAWQQVCIHVYMYVCVLFRVV
jgi:hypothetical protein